MKVEFLYYYDAFDGTVIVPDGWFRGHPVIGDIIVDGYIAGYIVTDDEGDVWPEVCSDWLHIMDEIEEALNASSIGEE